MTESKTNARGGNIYIMGVHNNIYMNKISYRYIEQRNNFSSCQAH